MTKANDRIIKPTKGKGCMLYGENLNLKIQCHFFGPARKGMAVA
jgi:hypothetical protein